MRCHPTRWLWGLIPIAMLSWLAVHVESGAIERDLEHRSAVALSAAGHDWAVVAFSGRDGLLVGQPPDVRQRDAALDVVRDVWGVRMVAARSAAPASLDIPIVPVAEQSPRRDGLDDVPPTLIGPDVSEVPPVASVGSVPLVAAEAPRHTVRAREQRVAALAAGVVTPPGTPASLAEVTQPVLPQVVVPPISAVPTAVAPPQPEPTNDSTPSVDVTPTTTPSIENTAPAAVAPTDTPTSLAEAPTSAPPVSEPPEVATAAAVMPPLSEPMKFNTPPVAVAVAPPPASESVTLNAATPPGAPTSPAEAPAAAPSASAPPETGNAAAVPPLPESKKSAMPRAAVMAAATSPAESAAPGVVAPLPERKPAAAPPPAVVPTTLAAATPTLPEPKTAAAAPPTAQRPPLPVSRKAATASAGTPTRFETAALPQSNIDPNTPCMSDVRGAAHSVELHFGRGHARLDRSGKLLIDRLIGTLNACPEAALHIAGHADASGNTRRNLALSRSRARGVAAYMVDKGIDAGRLAAVGYGETRPVAPNTTAANRAKNRRIEVGITARDAPVPPMPVRKQGTRNGLSDR